MCGARYDISAEKRSCHEYLVYVPFRSQAETKSTIHLVISIQFSLGRLSSQILLLHALNAHVVLNFDKYHPPYQISCIQYRNDDLGIVAWWLRNLFPEIYKYYQLIIMKISYICSILLLTMASIGAPTPWVYLYLDDIFLILYSVFEIKRVQIWCCLKYNWTIVVDYYPFHFI